MRKLVFTVLLSTALAASVAHAGLINNGGFETGDLTGWTCSQADCTNSALNQDPYWSQVSNAIANTGNFSFLAGASDFNLQNQPVYSTISQTLSTVAGQQYLLTFAYGEYNNLATQYNPDIPGQGFDCSQVGLGCYLDPQNIDWVGNDPSGSPLTNPFFQYNYLGVVIDGNNAFSDSNFLAMNHGDTQQGQGFYQNGSVSFTAASDSTTLEFQAFDSQADVTLDDVSVTEVTPEPGTLILLGGGLACIVGYRRSKKQ